MSLINYTTNIFIQVEYCFSLTLNLEVAYDPEKIALSTKTTLDGSLPASEAVQVNCKNLGRWGIPEKHESWYMKGESKLTQPDNLSCNLGYTYDLLNRGR